MAYLQPHDQVVSGVNAPNCTGHLVRLVAFELLGTQMALPKVREVMVADLRRRGASRKVIDDYIAHWNDAQMNSGKPISCPVCFFAGKKDSRLKALSVRVNVQRASCVVCGELFQYVDTS